MGFFDFVGNLFGLAAPSGINYFSNRETNKANERMQRETNAYNLMQTQITNQMNWDIQQSINKQNLALQHQAWNREDNAVQRRMSDLRAGGINPILAAGQAAQAGPAVKLEGASMQPGHAVSPQYQRFQMQTDLVERAMRMREDFATNAKTRELLEANTEEHRARAADIRQHTEQNADSFTMRLQQLASQVRSQNLHSVLTELQAEHQRLLNDTHSDIRAGVVLDNVHKELENQFLPEIRRGEITQLELKIAALSIANEVDRFDANTRHTLGITRTGSLPEKVAAAVANRGRQFYNFLRRSFNADRQTRGSSVSGNY